jgi:hypothetical protein
MLQAYRAGLLEPAYESKWLSRIRENWMLDAIERENDATQALLTIQVRAAFANLFEKPGDILPEMLKQIERLSGYKENNPAALLDAMGGQGTQMLQQLWRAMKQQGMLEPLPPK